MLRFAVVAVPAFTATVLGAWLAVNVVRWALWHSVP